MWDTVQTNPLHLSHDLPCPRCGHAAHTYLACSDTCDCARTVMPGTDLPTLLELAAYVDGRQPGPRYDATRIRRVVGVGTPSATRP